MPGPIAATHRSPARVSRERDAARPDDLASTVETAVLWRILWLRKTAVLATCGAFTALALVYCLTTPPIYLANAQILVDPRDKQVIANDVNPSGVAPDGGVTQVESQVSVVQSSGVLSRAIAATGLEADPEYNGDTMMKRLFAMLWLTSSRVGDDADADLKARTLNALRKSLTVKRADKVLVLDLAVSAKDPNKAARLANAIADAYLADQAQARADAGRQASNSLTSRLAELQTRVRDAENAVEDYRAQMKLVVSTGQLVSDQQLNELTTQLSAAQSRVASLKAQFDHQSRNRQGADATSEAMQSAVVTKLRDRESALVEKLASLGDKLGPLHPEFTAASAELKHVRELIAREIGRVGRATRADYERALDDEKALANKLEQLKNRSLADDKADVRLHELQRELEASKSVYNNFLVRAKETNELVSVDSTNARVITRALRPQQKSWPPTPLLLVGAALAGLALGASGAIAREYTAPTVMSASQIKAIVGAPVLGIIGASVSPARTKPVKGGQDPAPTQSEATAPARPDAATYRVVQVLLAGLREREPGPRLRYASNSVLVTSAPEDGAERARVARLIADVAARDGDEVLFVDADVAEGQESRARGFLDLMCGDQTFNSVLRPSAEGDYQVIEKGRGSSGPRAVGARREERVDAAGWQFSRAIRRFDLTVIDAGSLANNFALAPALKEIDEALLVAELGVTSHRSMEELAEGSEIMGKPISRIVLVDKTLRT